MEGESSSKRPRIATASVYQEIEEIQVIKSQKYSENIRDFIKTAQNFINDVPFFANNPSVSQICHVYTQKMFNEWQKENLSENCEFNNELQKFIKSHQIAAFKEFFASQDEFCGFNAEELFTMDEIASAGLIENNDDAYVFYHEIIRDVLVADYILDKFKEQYVNDDCGKCLDLIIWIFSKEELKEIRSFIDEGLEMMPEFLETILSNHKTPSPECCNLTVDELEKRIIDEDQEESSQDPILSFTNFAKKLIFKFEENPLNFVNIFGENLVQLAGFVIKILQRAENEKLRQIVLENFISILEIAKSSEIAEIFVNCAFEVLSPEDLKILIKKQNLLQKLPKFNQCSTFAAILTSKIEEKFSKSFVRDALLLTSTNILISATKAHIFEPENFKTIFDMLQIYLTDSDIESLLQFRQQNIFHVLIFQQHEAILKVVWTKIKDFFISKNADAKFRKLIFQKSPFCRNRTVLHRAADCSGLELHTTLWELLSETFVNSKDFKELLMQKDNDKNGFIHTLVTFNEEQVIDLTFKVLKEKLNSGDFLDVLKSKGYKDRNLIQKIADKPNKISVYECLWKNLCENFSSDEFKKILFETDKDGQNVLHVAASFSPGRVFDYLIQEISKILSRDEIRELLSSTNHWMENIFQSAVKLNLVKEFHEILWKNYKNYFNVEELMDFIGHKQKHGCNLMHVAVAYGSVDVNEFLWNEIKKLMNFEEQKEYLSLTGFRGMTLDVNCRKMNRKHENVQMWIENLLKSYQLM